ncbi:hypothetical protein GF378_01585 [Candidatus Pacearchaeota archaeon]|nr:hypothetical protein [Candidatus Pacearchaeota archaeon]
MKKEKAFAILFALTTIILTQGFASAQNSHDYKVDISPSKEVFQAGENISMRISIFDINNKPVNEKINITVENTQTGKSLEYTVSTNNEFNINLGEGANSGYWIVTVNYNNEETKALFEVETEEIAKLELKGESLKVTNIGNTEYSRTIQLIIGNTISTKNPTLGIGESVEYRLVAPQGSYNIKVTDGVSTVTQNQVSLTGTGQAIGAIDERSTQRSGITGGISPNAEDDIAILSFMKQGQLVYVFMLVIVGAFILLAIERWYSAKGKEVSAEKA